MLRAVQMMVLADAHVLQRHTHTGTSTANMCSQHAHQRAPGHAVVRRMHHILEFDIDRIIESYDIRLYVVPRRPRAPDAYGVHCTCSQFGVA